MRLRLVKWRSISYIWYRDFRWGGFQFANRKLCGWKVGRS